MLLNKVENIGGRSIRTIFANCPSYTEHKVEVVSDIPEEGYREVGCMKWNFIRDCACRHRDSVDTKIDSLVMEGRTYPFAITTYSSDDGYSISKKYSLLENTRGAVVKYLDENPEEREEWQWFYDKLAQLSGR